MISKVISFSGLVVVVRQAIYNSVLIFFECLFDYRLRLVMSHSCGFVCLFVFLFFVFFVFFGIVFKDLPIRQRALLAFFISDSASSF